MSPPSCRRRACSRWSSVLLALCCARWAERKSSRLSTAATSNTCDAADALVMGTMGRDGRGGWTALSWEWDRGGPAACGAAELKTGGGGLLLICHAAGTVPATPMWSSSSSSTFRRGAGRTRCARKGNAEASVVGSASPDAPADAGNENAAASPLRGQSREEEDDEDEDSAARVSAVRSSVPSPGPVLEPHPSSTAARRGGDRSRSALSGSIETAGPTGAGIAVALHRARVLGVSRGRSCSALSPSRLRNPNRRQCWAMRCTQPAALAWRRRRASSRCRRVAASCAVRASSSCWSQSRPVAIHCRQPSTRRRSWRRRRMSASRRRRWRRL